MKIEKRLLSELKPADYNPRVALKPEDEEYQKIKRSIERWGYIDPIIINSDGTIIGGHQRYSVLSELGYDEIDVVCLDLNKDDEMALNVALNKISGEWDELKLKDLLVELDIADFDLSLTGFSQPEIDDLIDLGDFESTVVDDGFDESKATESPAFVKQGEVWQLGRHRLMCGDSTSEDDVHKLMGSELMDLIVTDPPYNVNYEEKAAWVNQFRPNNNGAMEIRNDFLSDGDFYTFLLKCFCNISGIMRDGAAIYVFHADTEGLNFRKAYKDAGLKLAEVLIWEKSHFVLGRQDYQWRHEPVLYGWKEGAGHYFVKDRSQDTVIIEDDVDFEAMKKQDLVQYIKDLLDKFKDQTTVIYEKKPMSSSLHPTTKPIDLIGKFIKNSSKKGWNVGDLFGGSGSTLMAAEQLGRNAYLMEYDEKYASVIIKRWEEFTGQTAHRIEG